MQNPEFKASWSGGSQEYEGATARLFPFPEGGKRPSLVLTRVPAGTVEFFLAIDDDPAKAGTEAAADKIKFTFYPQARSGGNTYWFEQGPWKVGVDYSLDDEL